MFTRGFHDSARSKRPVHNAAVTAETLTFNQVTSTILDMEGTSRPHRAPIHSKNRLQLANRGLATGNGCWLLDLAQGVSSPWPPESFDLSPKQDPAKVNKPKNVSLQVRDAFEDPSEPLQDKVEIVHVRALATVVQHGNPVLLLRNLSKTLEPSGYLQWDGFGSGTVSAHSPSPSISKHNADHITEIWHKFAIKLSITLPWMRSCTTLENFKKHQFAIPNDGTGDGWDGPEDFKPLLRRMIG